ncbi:hypothetical protein CDD82_782 [Ophiocordyceps australis]|uniref:Uncharacterized protein n=1 Tax=Ophiocordyceps australis TaxID=1399860 RepID=A0A2C5ZHJ3_9HYPO|nr:hypothetical protein CDD82_782 [Ophiocordyceps australis]
MAAYNQSLEVSGSVTLDVKGPITIHMSRPNSTSTTIQVIENNGNESEVKKEKKRLAIFSALRRHGKEEPIRGLDISAPTMGQTLAMPSTDPRTGLSRPSSQCSDDMGAMAARHFFTSSRDDDDEEDALW